MNFIALYRGGNVATARIVGMTADEELVRLVAERLLDDPRYDPNAAPDAVFAALAQGHRHALKLVAEEENEIPDEG